MANTPFRRGPKIGRNDPCLCGSGRKFKHCHAGAEYALPTLLARDMAERQIIEQGRRLFEKHRTQELQRQKQQGLGRPIISIEHKGYRFVAVGNRLHYGKWKTFPDFLTDYIKQTLRREWGNAEIAKPLAERHPIMQWYDKMCRLQIAHAREPGTVFSMPMTGAVLAYNRLAYNLYLIAHNGKDIQTRLIARLKHKGNFQGAFFETQVAAWLIRAGFELEFEDELDRTAKHCEFTATYSATGDQYSVEAKSREIESDRSPRPRVGRKLYEALEKRANHKRLVFLDLNKPLHTQDAADIAMDRAERIVRQSEGMTIHGRPAPAAYVCIANTNDQYALDTSGVAMMISFRGFKIHDFMGDEFASLREAARARERHWPMFQLFRSMKEHREIPQTFGGELPSEVFGSNARRRLKVGQVYVVPGPDGVEVKATLVQATVADDKAQCILHDPVTSKSWLGTFDLTPDELADYARYPDTYFGVYQRQGRRVETAMEVFDFFVDCYRSTRRERLIELLGSDTSDEALFNMSQPELVELLAERYTMGMSVGGGAARPRGGRRHRPSIE
jgi:hypothetical protein